MRYRGRSFIDPKSPPSPTFQIEALKKTSVIFPSPTDHHPQVAPLGLPHPEDGGRERLRGTCWEPAREKPTAPFPGPRNVSRMCPRGRRKAAEMQSECGGE